MAATVVNTPNPGTIKLTRGKPVNLGTITSAANQAVQFTVPEPSRDHQGNIVIAVSSGIVLGTGAFNLEASIDGGSSWFTVVTPTAIVAASFTDAAVTAAFGPINVSGFGSGALFRFGVQTAATSGSAAVWALVG